MGARSGGGFVAAMGTSIPLRHQGYSSTVYRYRRIYYREIMHRSNTWDQRSVSTFSTEGSWASMPPYALDEDRQSLTSRSSLQSRGFRDGGPKEARLHRVAFLSLEKDVSHLYPVKVQHLPSNATPEKLKRTFESKIGDVQDVYVPLDAQRNKPVTDFAVVRFGSPESVQRALCSPSKELDGLQVYKSIA
ncbi:hypothetical protein EON63_10285 [archaeon]|nr:MAG: hypothetical protein EON63_10285 [archaeon]